jgi:hypothetical protein
MNMSKRAATIIIGMLLVLMSRATASGQAVKPPMVGRWRAAGVVLGAWPRQRTLAIDITIFPNDSVAGSVGDATLVGGWFTTRDPGSRVGLRWNTDYIILAQLDGPVIRAEGIWRPSVQIPLNWKDDRFVGGLLTTGWRAGSADHRSVEASVSLTRVVVAATPRAPITQIRILSW